MNFNMSTKNIQMQLKGKEIKAFEKEFKKSGFRTRSEFMRSIFFIYVKYNDSQEIPGYDYSTIVHYNKLED